MLSKSTILVPFCMPYIRKRPAEINDAILLMRNGWSVLHVSKTPYSSPCDVVDNTRFLANTTRCILSVR